jgi:hypothetical protein
LRRNRDVPALWNVLSEIVTVSVKSSALMALRRYSNLFPSIVVVPRPPFESMPIRQLSPPYQ